MSVKRRWEENEKKLSQKYSKHEIAMYRIFFVAGTISAVNAVKNIIEMNLPPKETRDLLENLDKEIIEMDNENREFKI
jgi:hypothetical protein